MSVNECDGTGDVDCGEIDVGLVNGDHDIASRCCQTFDFRQRQEPARGRVGVGENDAACSGCFVRQVVIDIDAEFVVNGDLLRRNAVERAICWIEAVGDVREQDGTGSAILFVLQEAQENVSQHLVGAIADKNLRGSDSLCRVMRGDGRFQAISIGVGVATQRVTSGCSVGREFVGDGREHVFSRSERVFVGVEFDEVGPFGLLARNVGVQVVDNGAPVGAHGLVKKRVKKGVEWGCFEAFCFACRCYHASFQCSANMVMRQAEISRNTLETQVTVRLNLDGSGQGRFSTGVPFLDHMLDQVARHGLIDIDVEAKGDLHIDAHHTVEDIGITFGQAIAAALGDKAGLCRYGHAYVPLDESLSRVVLDLSGRPGLVFEVPFTRAGIGQFDLELIREFFQAFVNHAQVSLHVDNLRGVNAHHQAESVFKAFARALRMAVSEDSRAQGRLPSTKGSL